MALISTEFFDCNTAQQATQTFGLTVPAGTKAAVAFWWRGYNNNLPTPTGITLGGAGMTSIGETSIDVNSGGGIRLLNNPATGAQNLVFTFDLNVIRVGVIVAYFDQNVTASGYLALASGSSGTISSASGQTAYLMVSDANTATLAPQAGTTEVIEYAGVNFTKRFGLYSKPGDTSVAVQTTATNPNDTLRLGCSILEAAAGFAAEWVLTR